MTLPTRRNIQDTIYLIGVGLFAIIWLSPLIEPARLVIPRIPSLIESPRIQQWLWNSLFVSTTHTTLQLVLCISAAYAFARIPFKGQRIVYLVVISGFMVPEHASFIPIYILFANLDLHNTYIALILPGVASPVILFLLTQFFRNIPRELDDAAKMDGASRLTILTRILVPLALPILFVIILYSFLANWNSYLWPLVSATKEEMWTITIALKKLVRTGGLLGGVAAAWLAGLPLLLFFFIFQRRIFNGLQLYSGFN